MATYQTKGSNGVSYGYRHTVVASDVSAREVLFDFQSRAPLVASAEITDDVGIRASLANLNLSYPANGQILLRDNALQQAIDLSNELKTLINLHYADETAHVTAPDTDNVIEASSAVDYVSMIALTTELLTSYDAHDADAELVADWVYHEAQEGADHSLTSAVAPTTIAEATARLNDLKAKYDAHEADTDAHGGAGSSYQTTVADVGTAFTFIADQVISVIAQYARGDV